MREPIAPTINMAGPQSLHLTLWKPNKESVLKVCVLVVHSNKLTFIKTFF